jgi:pilus assembly protein CpaB
MNRDRMLMGLLFAVVLAFFVSAFVYRQFKQVSSVPHAVQMKEIVVAAEPLRQGTRLDSSKLRLIPWPASEPVAGMFTRVEDCTNRALITAVAENEPILDSKLASVQAGAGLSATIPEGMRAVTVGVNDVIGVAGFVTPGTMVDVLVTGMITGPNTGGGSTITRTILENVRVLAAGQKIEQDRDGKPQTVPVITLLVTPDEAGKLTMASTEGKIQLALRNTVDTGMEVPPPVLQAALFAGAPPPPPPQKHAAAPQKSVPVPYTIEIITGTKRETKSFPIP